MSNLALISRLSDKQRAALAAIPGPGGEGVLIGPRGVCSGGAASALQKLGLIVTWRPLRAKHERRAVRTFAGVEALQTIERAASVSSEPFGSKQGDAP